MVTCNVYNNFRYDAKKWIIIIVKKRGCLWQRKMLQFLYAMSVDMNLVNGLENVLHAEHGIHFLKKKY